MKKILTGILGLSMVVAVVAGAAFAAFSSQTTMTNVSFAAGNADLRIWDTNNYSSTWNSTLNVSNMYPGYTSNYTSVWLKNNSTSPINLDVVMQLTDFGSAWTNDPMNYAVEVAVYDVTGGDWATDWMTLQDWADSARPLTLSTTPMVPDSSVQREFRVYERVPTVYGASVPGHSVGPKWVAAGETIDNEIANLSLPGLGFTLTGTQTP